MQRRAIQRVEARSNLGNNAPIWGGMRYPSTVTVGEAIANYVNANSMQLLRDPQ